METTYTILGADGLQYGPINLSQLKIWISEGRITPTTQVLRSDINTWNPAAQYTELGLLATATVPSVVSTSGAPVVASRRSAVSSIPMFAVRFGAGWLPMAFHAYALVWVFRGFKASGELKPQMRGSNVTTGQVQF